LAELNSKVGFVQQVQGNLAAALTSYRASFAIMDRLAKSDPTNTGSQSALALLYSEIGDVQGAQGNLAAVLTSYQASFAIRDRLAKSNPANPGWQSDLAMSYSKLATVYMYTKQPSNARDALAAGRDIVARMATQFADHSELKQELSWFDQQIAALKN
jgi:predicted Zn-dependent protease